MRFFSSSKKAKSQQQLKEAVSAEASRRAHPSSEDDEGNIPGYGGEGIHTGVATGNSEAIVVRKGSKWGATSTETNAMARAAQEVAVVAVSAGLVAGGMSSVIAPVAAVVIVVGHVAVRGVTRFVKRKLRVAVHQREHMEQVNLTKERAAEHLTMIINSTGNNGGQQYFNAFLSSSDNPMYNRVNSGHLRGISKLIGGSTMCNVRDMGGFTESAQKPFGVRLGMPDVLALIRQTWEYERFAETKCGTMTVIVMKSKRNKTKLRLTWNNGGDLEATPATVYTESEWKKTPFAGGTKTKPDSFADVDVTLDRSLIFL